MALLTGGTSASTSLSALLVTRAGGATPIANNALVNAGVLNDLTAVHSIWPGAYRNGILQIPNRGQLQCLPGDYVMFDSTTGWPILVSAYAIASGPWAHS